MIRRRIKRRRVISHKKEMCGVLVVASFIFLALSFFSHSSTDNSWFYFASDNLGASNWCGVVGAHVSALSFFLFGSAAYLFLFSLLFTALYLFRFVTLEDSPWRLMVLPWLVVVGSIFSRVYQIDFVSSDPGGLIGRFFDGLLSVLFGKTGCLIFLYSSVWISVLVLAQISFARLFLSLVSGVVFLFTCLGRFVAWLFFKSLIAFKKSFLYLFGLLKRKREPSVLFEEKSEAEVEAEADPLLEDPLLEELKSLAAKKTKRSEQDFTRQDFEKGFSAAKELDDLSLEEEGQEKEAIVAYSMPDFSRFQEADVDFGDKESFERECRERGKKLEEKLLHFGIKGKVVAIRPGPVITLFEYKPEIDSKISKIISLEDDLAMALTALSIRTIAPIPGRNVVGFEISNRDRADVFLSQVIESEESKTFDGHLPLAFGVDITGNPVVYDLVTMPHILVAGSTGSGKSVGLNAMLTSLLYRLSPDELKVILIDPKRLEFAPYADIPHLLFPIVTNSRKAIPVLKWVVQEMEDRYDIMARFGVRSIVDYRKLYSNKGRKDKAEMCEMPFIVLIIDELADLMMVAGKDVETNIARTAQMARAAGIHMVIATQRPSVDVLTGVIKANFPARIAFRVSSKIDSRTIIDSQGAEKLLGRGDMLFLNSGSSVLQRIHGAYLSGSDISRFTDHLRKDRAVEYLDLHEVLRREATVSESVVEDELYKEVLEFIRTVESVSISLLQRKYRIGFNRSARIIEKLEQDGLVSTAQGGKVRRVIK